MFREYTREQYLERIAWMKGTRKRRISITTDVIVGFPGETETEFQETLGLLDEVQYDGVFSFKYSPRPNTPALRYIDTVAEEEKSRRLQILMERQREIQRANYRNHIGEVIEVMVEAEELRSLPVDRPHFAEQDFEFLRAAGRAARNRLVSSRARDAGFS